MPHPSTSSAYGIWSLNEVRDAERGDNWPSLPPPWSVNLSDVTYDSVNFLVSGQDATPRDIVFNTDGTKMYMVGSTSDRVYQYTLSTGFDLSTASYDSVNFSVSSQDDPLGIYFNTDGTKMYMVGATNDRVYQYSLSTPFSISTASYDSVNFSVAGQDTIPRGIRFNNEGTKMYIVGDAGNDINQYTLSTAFDLSTASFDSVTFSVSSQDTAPQDLDFNEDGTKMYVVGEANDSIFQYTLSTAFDISTASYDSISFSTASQETVPTTVIFSNDGTKMYVLGISTDRVYQYSTGL